jgi:hypothetical protein
VALYSMHLRDGTEALFDPRAREFSDLDALRTAVLIAARDLLNRDAGNGMLDSRFRIDAEDAEGSIVYSLRLERADYATTPTLNTLAVTKSGDPKCLDPRSVMRSSHS